MLCIKCKNNKAAGKQKWCTECKRDYDRKYYQCPENKKRHNQKTKENQRKFVEWSNSLKEAPCKDCDTQYHPAAMQWDHLPQFEKTGNVADLQRRGNKNLILEEIAKCELVCANCHAIRTHNRNKPLQSNG